VYNQSGIKRGRHCPALGGLDSALAILLPPRQNIEVTLSIHDHFGCDLGDRSSRPILPTAVKLGFNVKLMYLGQVRQHCRPPGSVDGQGMICVVNLMLSEASLHGG
jgi:hypothetical protein